MTPIECLKNYGFYDEEIQKIISNYSLRRYTDETLVNNINDTISFFLKLKISMPKIHKMLVLKPELFSRDEDNRKDKYQNLLDLGYKEEQLKRAMKFLMFALLYSINNVNDKVRDIESIGFTRDEVLKMLLSNPQLLGKKINEIKDTCNYLITLGFTLEQVLIIGKNSPSVYNYSDETLKLRFDIFKIFIGDKESAIKAITGATSILTQAPDTTNNKIKAIMALGYTEDEVRIMIIATPVLLEMDSLTLQARHKGIQNPNFSKEEIHRITVLYPTALANRTATVNEKMNFIVSIGLKKAIIDNPRNLIQSIDLTYARYLFLKDNGVFLNSENYTDLFRAEARFKKKYNITKAEILEKYSYEAYKKSQGGEPKR